MQNGGGGGNVHGQTSVLDIFLKTFCQKTKTNGKMPTTKRGANLQNGMACPVAHTSIPLCSSQLPDWQKSNSEKSLQRNWKPKCAKKCKKCSFSRFWICQNKIKQISYSILHIAHCMSNLHILSPLRSKPPKNGPPAHFQQNKKIKNRLPK